MKKQLFAGCLLLSFVSIAKMSFGECNEYKIIDHGDRVEAVCVGSPLTEAEKVGSSLFHVGNGMIGSYHHSPEV